MVNVNDPRPHCLVCWNSDRGPNSAAGTPRVIVEPTRAGLAWARVFPRFSLAYGTPKREAWACMR